MAWGPKTDATPLERIISETFFDQEPILADGGVAHCQLSVAFALDAIDDAIVRVYATLDGATWDVRPIRETVIERVPGGNSTVSFTIDRVYQFRIGVESLGELPTVGFSFRLSGQEEGASAG